MVFCNIKTKCDFGQEPISHNPYFNRWFSAIAINRGTNKIQSSHNPYFNRWFSAIIIISTTTGNKSMSQSLF